MNRTCQIMESPATRLNVSMNICNHIKTLIHYRNYCQDYAVNAASDGWFEELTRRLNN